jgi:glycosyltransferase involved in cell wall biosynthesis
MLVSIITACYNSETYILDTYNSIFNQTYKNWEWVIVNDCSSDNSLNIINKFVLEDKRIHLINNEIPMGAAISRNLGIKFAKGNYITFIDSDDIWKSDFIEKSLNFMIKNNYNFIFSSYERRDVSLQRLQSIFKVPEKVSFNDILYTCPISCLTAFINLDNLPKLYMPNLNSRQDFGLWLKYLKFIDFAYGLNEPLAVYRVRKISLSRNKFKVSVYQFLIYYEILNFNIFKSLYYTFCWFLNGIKKYYLN